MRRSLESSIGSKTSPAASIHRTPPPSVRRKQRRRRSLSYRFAFSLRESLFNDCIVSFASFDPPKTTKLTTVGLLHPNVSVFIGRGSLGRDKALDYARSCFSVSFRCSL